MSFCLGGGAFDFSFVGCWLFLVVCFIICNLLYYLEWLYISLRDCESRGLIGITVRYMQNGWWKTYHTR